MGLHLGDLCDFTRRLQCAIEDLLDGDRGVERQPLSHLLGNIVQIAAVSLGQDHVGQAGCMGLLSPSA